MSYKNYPSVWSSPVWTLSVCLLLSFSFGNIFLPSSKLFLRLGSLAYASLSSESKRSRGLESLFFLRLSHEFGRKGTQQYSGFWFLSLNCNWSSMEVSKFTVLFIPIIISSSLSSSIYSCSLACSNINEFSTSSFIVWFIICGNFHELLLGSGLGNIVSLFHMVCQSTLFQVWFVTFFTFGE